MTARRRESLRDTYERRRHTILLVAIVCALSARPLIADRGAGPIVFSLAMLLLLLAAMFALRVDELAGERDTLVAQRRRRMTVAWALASAAIAERLYMTFVPTPRALLLGSLAWLLFLSFVTWSLLRQLLQHKQITGETISMSVSIYLLIGITWGLLYAVILQVQPDAFHFPDPTVALTAETEAHTFPILIYFSLTTLSTVGFGDITPVTLLARYAAVIEALTGQMYLAILVARLVGLQMSQR